MTEQIPGHLPADFLFAFSGPVFSFLSLGPFAYIFGTSAFASVDSGAAQAHLQFCIKTGNVQGERMA